MKQTLKDGLLKDGLNYSIYKSTVEGINGSIYGFEYRIFFNRNIYEYEKKFKIER